MYDPDPNTPNRSYVEQVYNEALDRMTPVERVKRGFALHKFAVAALRCQIGKESPEISERELRIRIAEIMYLSDTRVQELLQKARQHD